MSESEDSSKFRLDLDNADFLAKTQEAIGSIKELGGSENMSGLIEGLTEAGAVLGTVGLAIFAMKESIDLVFDAEKINQVNQQFETLSKNAGVYATTLKEGLKDASAGWVDDTTLMEAANAAMVKLETGVEQLPELMELARKATLVFGGDVTQNFNQITQAVSSGNSRMLKHLGIIVDQEKAYRDFATAQGVTVESLSLAGKQQAILNAALEAGKTAYAGVTGEAQQSISVWNQVKATITDLKDVIVLAFEKVAGPTVSNFFKNLKAMADDAKTYIQDKFGSGADQTAAHLQRVQDRIQAIKGALIDLDQKKIKGTANSFDTSQIVAYEAELKKLQTELPQVQAQANKNAQDEIKNEQAVTAARKSGSGVDPVKQKKQEADAAKELAVINRTVAQEELKQTTDMGQAEKLYIQQKLQDGKQVQAQIDQVRAKQAQGLLTDQQANAQVEALDKEKTLKMKQNADDLWKFQQQALNNYVRQSTSAFNGVERAFQSTAQKSKHDLQDWGKFGDATVTSFSQSAVSNMQAWGAGTKSATDAIEGMFAGMAGQMASQYGALMMLAAIWPPNPPAFAAGLGLVALGGLLSSLGGSSSSVSSSASASAPGTAAPTVNLDSTTAGASPTSDAATQAAPSKTVSIVVQGHLFANDQQQQRWFVDQIRAASDATDFRVQNTTGAGL